MNHGNIASAGGKVYILGRLSGGGSLWTGLGDNFVYDPAVDIWDRLPSPPSGTERGASAMGVCGKRIIVAGGLLYVNLTSGSDQLSSELSVTTVSMFDTETRKWKYLQDFPEGRDHFGGQVIWDVFYVIGGCLSGRTNVRGTMFALNLMNPELGWTLKTPIPTARGGISTTTIGTKIFTFGGESDFDTVPNGTYDDVEVYDTETDSWIVLDPMPSPTHGTNSAAVGNHIYIPGGGKSGGGEPMDTNDFFAWEERK